MSHYFDQSSNRELSQSSLHYLHMQIVEYFMRGYGAHFFEPQGKSILESEEQKLAITSAKRKRIEALAIDIGTRLVESVALDRDRLDHPLDMVKFICKDFWEHIFKKQIDVLRTNHRGLYVLTDNNFRWLSSVSQSPDHPGSPEDYVLFPCGLVCGALTRLGLKCRVTAEIVPLETAYKCSFNVQVIQN